MDYSLITEEEVSRRFESAPSAISNLLNSADEKKTIDEISRTHYLNEDKRLILEQLVSLVLLGFVSPNELATEMSNEIPLNFHHSRALAKEIDEKVFAFVRDDLKSSYAPPSEDLWEKESEERPEGQEPIILPFAFGPLAKDKAPEEKTGIKMEPGEKASQLKDGPLIIHSEKTSGEEKKRSSLFSFPLNLIKPRTRTGEGASVRAHVEAPKERVVHYSELRTPVSPFGKGGNDSVKFTLPEKTQRIEIAPTINTPEEKPVPIIMEAPKIPQAKPAPQPNIKGFWRPEQAKKPVSDKAQPKIEGNTVDLR
ncbi:MAG: hypothetical protein AAB617_02215 [Patescibacteria group bacterium]